jgi:hypothetical protein
VYFSAGAGGLLCRDCEANFVEKRRVRSGLPSGFAAKPVAVPSAGDAAEWFALLDYHLTYVAGREFRTAAAVAAALAQGRSPGGAGRRPQVGK